VPLLSAQQHCYLQQHLQALLLLPQPPHHLQQQQRQQQLVPPLPHQWVLLQHLPLLLSGCIAAAAC
jgi:hypothetical protein